MGKSKASRAPVSVQTRGRLLLSERGIRASVLREIAEERIAESKLLMSRDYFSGAAYLVGYGVELLLKARVAQIENAGYWPLVNIKDEHRTHSLELLLIRANLHNPFQLSRRANRELEINWLTLRGWSPTYRYERLQRRRASDIVGSVVDEPNGVAPWLRLRF
jgi:hypothetical protein